MLNRQKALIILALWLYCFLFFWRFKQLQPQVPVSGTQVEIVAVLSDEPEVLEHSQKFRVAGLKITAPRYPEYHYQDRLKITGTVGNYRAISFPIITKLGTSQSNLFQTVLLRGRYRLEAVINQSLPSPQSSLLIGMLLGIKNLPRELTSDLRRSGLIHIVVASGGNVTVIASFFLHLGGFVERKKTLVLSLLAIFFYTLMVGADPPIVRAALMGGLAYLAKIFGREAYQLITLILVVSLMLLVNPFYIFDLSFQLSFLATIGIVLFTPLILGSLKRVGRGMASAIATTAAAQLFVTPLLISQFGQLAVSSLLANVLVFPIIEPVMVLGFPFAVLGVFTPPISRLLTFFLWLALTYFIHVAHFFSSFDTSVLKISKIPFFVFLPYYLFLFYLRFRLRRVNTTPDARNYDRGSESQVTKRGKCLKKGSRLGKGFS